MSTKVLVLARDESRIWTEIAVYDDAPTAIKDLNEVLGDKVNDWFVSKNEVECNGKIVGETYIYNHNTTCHSIIVATIAHNTLKDDPTGISQEFIREWARL